MKRYVCSVCGYVYDEGRGVPERAIPPGTKWEDLPENWVCPLCGAAKSEFAEEGGQEEKPPAAKRRAETKHSDLRELRPMEISAICSNLARGCEKQYKPEEAARFTELAQHYRAQAAPVESPSFVELTALVEQDLESAFPEANAAAQADRGARRALVWSEKVTRILKSLLERYEREGEAMLEGTGVYLCTICGFVYVGDTPPDICPVCKVPSWKFEKVEGR